MGLRDRLKGALGLGAHTHLNPGDAAPALDVADGDGKRWTLADLRGAPFVLYFYPADDTPGCTREACGFRDQAVPRGVRVLGASKDAASSHRAFVGKYNLGFPLLTDPDGALCRRWGTDGGNARRVTFLVNAEGRIAEVWDPVKVDGHVDAVMAALARV